MSPEFLLHGLQTLPTCGTDHFPILIGSEYHPGTTAAQEIEAADHQDRREARESLEVRDAGA